MIRPSRSTTLLVGLLAATACGGSDQAAPPAGSTGSAQLPANHPPIPGMATPTGAPQGPFGQVLESMNSAGYTYARVGVDDGEVWVAGPVTALEVGDVIALGGGMGMTNFRAASLDRTFDNILFLNSFVKAADPGTESRGKVVETADAAGYTYLRVETPEGERWLAAPPTEAGEGDIVAWSGGMTMTDFQSTALDRRFEEILFVERLRKVY